MVRLAAKREATQHAVTKLGLTERRACQLVSIERSTFRRKSIQAEPEVLRTRIKELAELRRRYVYRIYKEEKLFLKIRKRKRLASVVRVPTQPPQRRRQLYSRMSRDRSRHQSYRPARDRSFRANYVHSRF